MISPDNKIYFGQTGAIGWVDIAAWDKTHDAEASQGWCPAVLDTNGDGRISEWTEPNAPIDPAKDHRINFGCYSIAVSPKDGSLWCSGIGRGDKRLMRMDKGSNPPQTCASEFYEPPAGQAIDIMIPDSATGDAIADVVQDHYKALGVSEIIWSQHIWTVQRMSEGWRWMEDRGSDTANNYDHVHVTVY